MALETVRVVVKDEDSEPVDDVVVRFFDEDSVLVTEATTGDADDGTVEVELEGDASPIRYTMRFFIRGGRIKQPKAIDIYSPAADAPTGANSFEVPAILFAQDQATDPRLCRASGVVRGPNGLPKRAVEVHFIPKFNPLVVEDQLVLGERVSVRTDKDGYITVDLFRNGMYEVTIESHENVQRDIVVPDRSNVKMSHLLFPIVNKVTYDPAGPWTLEVDEELEITPNVQATDYQDLGVAAADVTYRVDDESVAAVKIVGDRIVLRGIAAGATALRVTRNDNSIVYTPDPGIAGDSVGIVVTAP